MAHEARGRAQMAANYEKHQRKDAEEKAEGRQSPSEVQPVEAGHLKGQRVVVDSHSHNAPA